MFFFERDKLSRFGLFGEDEYELLQTSGLLDFKFTEGDEVRTVDLRTLNPMLEQL
jgi:hypothetical protein